MVCQKKHWKVGGHRAECAALAAAAAVPIVGEATKSDGTGMAEGKEDEIGGGPSVGVASGGNGGGRDKKGGKKGKKGRR